MAALFHAVNDPVSTEAWLKSWSSTLNDPQIGAIRLRTGMLVIGESLHRQRYKFLWDLLFERHPHGAYIKCKWEGMAAAKTDIPSDQLILRTSASLSDDAPAGRVPDLVRRADEHEAIPLEELGVQFHSDTIGDRQGASRPAGACCLGSQRSQRRVPADPPRESGPNRFQGGGSPEQIQHDRRRMLLHRLFENRLQIAPTDRDQDLIFEQL